MLHFAGSTEYPPHPDLSLGEREQLASDLCLADGRCANRATGVIERRWTVLPLPKGEGRGEGEPSGANPTVQSVFVWFVFIVRFLSWRGCLSPQPAPPPVGIGESD